MEQEPTFRRRSWITRLSQSLWTPATSGSEAEEEAVLNSMVTANAVTGFDGTVKRSLREFMPEILAWRG